MLQLHGGHSKYPLKSQNYISEGAFLNEATFLSYMLKTRQAKTNAKDIGSVFPKLELATK